MGSYDCYCAVCGGPLYSYMRRGKTSPKYLAARRNRVARNKKKLAGEVLSDAEDEVVDTEMKDGDPSVCQCESSCMCPAEEDESGSMDEWDEEHSYDPELISKQETKWLGEARAVGFNPNAEGISKAFISGNGTYDDYGDFHVSGPAIDSNDPEQEPYPCYYSWNTKLIPVFPFHEACSKMLRFAIFEHSEGRPNVKVSAFEGVNNIKSNVQDHSSDQGNDEDDENENSGDEEDEGADDEEEGDEEEDDEEEDDEEEGDEENDNGDEVNEDEGDRGNKIDKDLLYSVMTQLANDSRGMLDVDYGDIDGIDQTWECLSGEEFSVYNPIIDRKLEGTLRKLLANTNLGRPSSTLDLEAKVRHDPFARLPPDIIYMILPYLPKTTPLVLMQASWYIHRVAQDRGLWKQLIRRNILPWFWEFENIFVELPEKTDFKMLYLWLDKSTKAKFGMDGPLMATANRRRIWHVCDVIRHKYWKLDEEETARWKDCVGEAYEIMDSAISTQLPMTMYPKPQGTKTITSQWICSWDEIDSRGEEVTFESYWSVDGNLVGLAVVFGSDRRELGKGTDKELGIVKKSVSPTTRGWISGVILHICGVDSSRKMEQKATIKALTITLTSGETLDVGSVTPNLNQRALLVWPGMHFVGFIAEVAVVPRTGSEHLITQNRIKFSYSYNDVITRLGLLQAANPAEGLDVDFDPFEFPQEQRLLWHPSTAKIGRSPSDMDPIWGHAMDRSHIIRMISYEYGDRNDEIPLEILPHYALVWAKDVAELKQIRRISAFVLNDGTPDKLSGGHEERVNYGIHGIRVEFQDEYAEPRTIGCGSLPPGFNRDEDSVQVDTAEWDDSYLQHFDIDGPGGEYITSIHIAEDCKAIRLRTNRQRECYWGEKNRSKWNVQKLLDGPGVELPRDGWLVGIVVVFGTKSHWTWKTESGEWLKSSAATGLFVGNEATIHREHT